VTRACPAVIGVVWIVIAVILSVTGALTFGGSVSMY
jgi:hypothetical protein